MGRVRILHKLIDYSNSIGYIQISMGEIKPVYLLVFGNFLTSIFSVIAPKSIVSLNQKICWLKSKHRG